MNKKLVFSTACVLFARVLNAQVASGGRYTLDQQVVASGGGSSSGPNYTVEGTIGQSVAGTQSVAGNFTLHGGFWQPFFSPTAAHVTIVGQVVSSRGMGIAEVRLTLTDASGRTQQSLSNPFGFFRFDDIEAGQTYVLSASSKQYSFSARLVNVDDAIDDLTIVAIN